MSKPKDKEKIQLKSTEGIEDYVSIYKTKLEGGGHKKIIESAKYFIQLRKSHLREILDRYEEIEEEGVDIEKASVILNEFLSSKCTLLEFEFKNLTKVGQEDKEAPKIPKSEQKFNEIWQKHILGRVLTNDEHEISINIPANANSMFSSDHKGKSKIQEVLTDDGEGTSSNDVEGTAVEVFTLYKRVQWFIKSVGFEKINATRFQKTDLRKAIDKFNRSFSTTWKTITCLVYLDIIETMRSDANNIIGVVFAKCSNMMMEDKNGGPLSKESTDMLNVADMFIKRYRAEWTDDDMFRCGLAYLSIKLQLMKMRPDGGDPNVLSVCSLLSDEEVHVTEVYDVMKQFDDFSSCEF